MYRTTITLKDGLTKERIEEIHKIAEEEFDNRIGKLENVSTDKNTLIFESEKEDYLTCIMLANLGLYKRRNIKQDVKKWTFIDTEDTEDGEADILKDFSEPIYV